MRQPVPVICCRGKILGVVLGLFEGNTVLRIATDNEIQFRYRHDEYRKFFDPVIDWNSRANTVKLVFAKEYRTELMGFTDEISPQLSDECVVDIYAELQKIDPVLCDPCSKKVEDIIGQIGILSPEQIIQEIESCEDRSRIYLIMLIKFEHAWHELGPDLLAMLVNSSEHGERYQLDAAEYLLAEQRLKEAYMMLDGLTDEHSNTLRARIVEVMAGMTMGTLNAGTSSDLMLQLIELLKIAQFTQS
jgi:hypothetical protein